jgi:hypothetical protein
MKTRPSYTERRVQYVGWVEESSCQLGHKECHVGVRGARTTGCLGACRECDAHLEQDGRETTFCPRCDTCPECGTFDGHSGGCEGVADDGA